MPGLLVETPQSGHGPQRHRDIVRFLLGGWAHNMERRDVLRLFGWAATVASVVGPLDLRQQSEQSAAMPWRHAIGDPRGSDIAIAVGRDKEGRFGVLFKRQVAFAPDDDLLRRLAESMHDPG